MRETFAQSLKALQDDLARMGAIVESMVHQALEALARRDIALANKVMAMDDDIDHLNLDIENRCLELIALQQPLARDLRTIAAAMKIITDIERMGDYAVDMAKEAIKLADRPLFKPLVDIPRMGELVKEMLRESLEAFASRDLDLVRRVIERDDAVDHLQRALFDELIDFMVKDSSLVFQSVHLIMITRYLERIADHITNVGERVIYMETGELAEFHK
jgi:phosphate transport system protein